MNRRGRRNEEPPRRTEAQIRREAIQGFQSRKHHHPMWVDMDVLERSGIRERVEVMLNTSGWPGVLNLYSEADVEDTSEFMGTFRYIGRENQQGFAYRHRGQPYECTMNRLRRIFGWPADGEVYDPEGNWGPIWNVIAPTKYDGGKTQAKDIPDPAIFYLHHLMSKTLFARKNVDKIGQLEMSVLAMLKTGAVVHWGHYWCLHLDHLRTNSPIACGGMVTYFLRERHQTPEVATHTSLYGKRMDYTYFRAGRSIEPTAAGYQWVYFGDENLRPPAEEPRDRPRGADRGRRVRGRALVIHEPQPDQPEQQDHQPDPQPAQQPPQPALFCIHTLFNATRASIFAGRPFQWMPAPEGWSLGDPIPPEYLM